MCAIRARAKGAQANFQNLENGEKDDLPLFFTKCSLFAIIFPYLLLFFLILLLCFEGNRHDEMNPKSGFGMLYEHSLAAQVSQLKE